MLNLKLQRRRFAASAALLGIAAVLLLSLGACSEKEKDLIPYRKGKKWGFSDVNKKLVIQPKYDTAEPFSDGLARVQLAGLFGYIDKKGKEVIPVKYGLGQNLDSFSDGLLPARLDGVGEWGYISRTGSAVIPFKYSWASSFSEGLAAVSLNHKSGYIDESGNVVIPFKYDASYPFSDGLARVQMIGPKFKWGFIDKNGKEITPIKYDDARSFSDGLAVVKLNNKWGYIDKNGKEVIPLEYDGAQPFAEDLAIVAKTAVTRLSRNLIQTVTNWSYIDKNGKEVIPISKYDAVSSFSEGLACVGLNGKLGYIDKSGKEVIPFKYEIEPLRSSSAPDGSGFIAGDFSEDLAIVRLDEKWGYIDKSGKVVIPFKYRHAHSFVKALGMVELNGEIGYIGRDGTEYFEP